MEEGQNLKKDFIWNTMGSAIYALSSMVLSFFVLHFAGPTDGGIFSFGFSTLGHQLHLVACFGIRAYHITDMRREYSYEDYRRFRMYTSVVAMLLGFMYLALMRCLGEYSLRKCFIIFMLVLYKICDAIGELYESETQRLGKLYIGGEELTVRTVIASGILIVTLLISKNVILSACLAVFAQLIVLYIFRTFLTCNLLGHGNPLHTGIGGGNISPEFKKNTSFTGENISGINVHPHPHPYPCSDADHLRLNHSKEDIAIKRSTETSEYGDFEQTGRLFKSTVLIFIIVFMDFYIFSSSKYAVDLYMTDMDNGIYNVLFMPTSTIYLLANFVTRPFISRLSVTWTNGQKERFKKESNRLLLYISGISAVCFLGAALLGRIALWILELLLGINYSGLLTSHHLEFCLIILGGCGYALIFLFYYLLVIMRKQNCMFLIYLFTIVAAFFISRFFVSNFGLMGASIGYVMTMGLLTAALWIAARVFLRSNKDTDSCKDELEGRFVKNENNIN